MAQIALAWLVTPGAGYRTDRRVTSVAHLEDAVEAVELSLSESDLAYLEAPYEPVAVSGHE